MAARVEDVLKAASETLGVSQNDLTLQGVRHYLESRLHDVQADIFQITGRYSVADVEDMERRYREGSLEEETSWRDMQRLDHLEYQRGRLVELLKSLP